ncbi:MAG: glycosyltransferase [Deltaproteobacteria bacterium]|nr:glycosyltransferase [Deltaproteobacteria bacterium]
MLRWAQNRRVFFFEEPIDAPNTGSHIKVDPCGVVVVTPLLPKELSHEERVTAQRALVDEVVKGFGLTAPVLWYYTPMALPFSRHLEASAVVYDCMDELSGFLGCPPELRLLERELMSHAHVMFTGGQSLFENKRKLHRNVHAFPSSVDVPHFAKARVIRNEPDDQANIPHPRIGFHGVIDERMDLDLLRGIAELRPDWHFVVLGPVVKIDEALLPRNANIHYLGSKSYDQLPAYLGGWDATMLPFALNEATRYISPTKTPEYLAGGKGVVSTPIHDVVKPYGEQGLVRIANTPQTFVKAVEACLAGCNDAWLLKVDRFLSNMSWDRTWQQMYELVEAVAQRQSGAMKQVG